MRSPLRSTAGCEVLGLACVHPGKRGHGLGVSRPFAQDGPEPWLQGVISVNCGWRAQDSEASSAPRGELRCLEARLTGSCPSPDVIAVSPIPAEPLSTPGKEW